MNPGAEYAFWSGGDWPARQWKDYLLPWHVSVHARDGAEGRSREGVRSRGPRREHNAPTAMFRAPPISSPQVAVVNLDPANDVAPYQPDVDISDLVDLSAVMEVSQKDLFPARRRQSYSPHRRKDGFSSRAASQEFGLGPNGGLLYCMDYLEKNLDWLKTALEPFEKGRSEI